MLGKQAFSLRDAGGGYCGWLGRRLESLLSMLAQAGNRRCRSAKQRGLLSKLHKEGWGLQAEDGGGGNA